MPHQSELKDKVEEQHEKKEISDKLRNAIYIFFKEYSH